VKPSPTSSGCVINPVMGASSRGRVEVLTLSHDTQKEGGEFEGFAGEGQAAGASVTWWRARSGRRVPVVLARRARQFLAGLGDRGEPSTNDWNGRAPCERGPPGPSRSDGPYQPLYVPRPVVEPELFDPLGAHLTTQRGLPRCRRKRTRAALQGRRALILRDLRPNADWEAGKSRKPWGGWGQKRSIL